MVTYHMDKLRMGLILALKAKLNQTKINRDLNQGLFHIFPPGTNLIILGHGMIIEQQN